MRMTILRSSGSERHPETGDSARTERSGATATAAEVPIRVFIGADSSQALASRVLEYSIRRHTDAPVEVHHMIDLPVPRPASRENWPRTGFSFARFCIPELAGRQGRAIYLDADMLVFGDIRELWSLPFNGASVLIQREVAHVATTLRKRHAPAERKLQCSVMLLDCARLDWDIATIVSRMDAGEFDYERLMSGLCIVDDADLACTVPPEWNSLEHRDAGTRLLHYTDMGTQPWVSTRNPNADVWYAEVRQMLADGSLAPSDLQSAIAQGYFRPSLYADIAFRERVPRLLRPLWNRWLRGRDRGAGYRKHRVVNEERRIRLEAGEASPN